MEDTHVSLGPFTIYCSPYLLICKKRQTMMKKYIGFPIVGWRGGEQKNPFIKADALHGVLPPLKNEAPPPSPLLNTKTPLLEKKIGNCH